jgi:hypothetical protein
MSVFTSDGEECPCFHVRSVTTEDLERTLESLDTDEFYIRFVFQEASATGPRFVVVAQRRVHPRSRIPIPDHAKPIRKRRKTGDKQ